VVPVEDAPVAEDVAVSASNQPSQSKPADDDDEASLEAAREEIEKAKEISKEVFMLGLQRLLNLAIEGYPRAVRSTVGRRNELLRRCGGDQDAAVERIADSAAKLSEEGKTWVLGLVPFVGLPSSILYPTWTLLRRVCLVASTYGHDLKDESVRAKILGIFAKMRSVPVAEYTLECAVQAVWVAFAGPAANFIPVGALVSKVANVEGHVLGMLGKETFEEGRRLVPEADYLLELDPEPGVNDYVELAKDGLTYAAVRTWAGTQSAVVVALDAEKREEILKQMNEVRKSAVATATVLGKGAVAAAPGAMSAAANLGKAGVKAGLSSGGQLVSGSKKQEQQPQ